MADIITPTDMVLEQDAALEASVGDYFALLKPRVMSLVVFTALVGLIAAPEAIDPVLGFTALICIALGAGASGALNMWYDADIDVKMQRTKGRPVPMGRIAPGEALGFGLFLSVFSVLSLGLLVNWVAAGLLGFTIFFYAVVYTMWLKRSTPHNIVIGGAAGAFPPMVGWASASGSVTLDSFLLFAIIFLWTPPHFWALALYRCRDYANAGVPMLPVVAGSDETRRQILIYSLILVPVAIAPVFTGLAGVIYGIVSVVASGVFIARAVKVYQVREGREADAVARKLFLYSIFYLFLLFAVILFEHATGLLWNLSAVIG